MCYNIIKKRRVAFKELVYIYFKFIQMEVKKMVKFRKLTVKENSISFIRECEHPNTRITIDFLVNQEFVNFKTLDAIQDIVAFVDKCFIPNKDDIKSVRKYIRYHIDRQQRQYKQQIIEILDLRNMVIMLYYIYDKTTGEIIMKYTLTQTYYDIK